MKEGSRNKREGWKRKDQQKHQEKSSIMIDSSYSESKSEQSEVGSTSSSQESEDEVGHKNHKRVSPISVEPVRKKLRTNALPIKETVNTELKKAEYGFALGLDLFILGNVQVLYEQGFPNSGPPIPP